MKVTGRKFTTQKPYADKDVLEAIAIGRIAVDAQAGIIYGAQRFVGSPRKPIGYQTTCGPTVTLQNHKTKAVLMLSACRIIYLSVHGDVPEEMAVIQVDDTLPPSIDNLTLTRMVVHSHGQRFTEDERALLVSLWPTLTIRECAERLGRSFASIRQAAKLLGLPSRRGERKPFSEEEKAELGRLIKAGHSVEQIAELMGKSACTVRKVSAKYFRAFTSRKHIKLKPKSANFYLAMKGSITRGTTVAQCCLCDYHKHIDLHHIDGDHSNNRVENLATLCPNHHREVGAGEHPDARLYSIWWRVYPDGEFSETLTNLEEQDASKGEEAPV